MPITERACRVGAYERSLAAGRIVFGLVLVVSAVGKLAAPLPAATSLAWTGLALGTREALVVLGSLAETVVGAGLVLLPGSRPVRWAGTGVALALLLMHSLGTGDHCGCFGEAKVPDWISLGLVVCGLASTALAVERPVGATRARPSLVLLACLLASMPISWALLRPQASRAVPSERLAAELRRRDAVPGSLVVVGSKGCSHCEAALRELANADQGGPLWLATRAGAEGVWERTPGFEVRMVTIADDLWWELVADRLPSIWRLEVSGLVGLDRPGEAR